MKEVTSNRVPENGSPVKTEKLVKDFTNITPAPKQAHYPLSSSQRRLWVLSQFEDANVAYNMPSVYIFDGILNKEAFAFAFSALIARHESLRTVFRQDEEGDVRQYIKSAAESGAAMKFYDLRGDADAMKKVEPLVQAEVTAPFDLENGPLIRAGLFQVEETKWVFAGTMHHIVSDGWSMEVLIYELMLFYHAHLKKLRSILPPLKFHYKDFSVWQQEQLQYGVLHTQQKYWHNQLSGVLPMLELQGDMPRPALKTYNGATMGREFTLPFSKRVVALCHSEGCTLFMGVLAAVKALLYRYTGQEDIIVGSPIAGREHLDLEGQIGFYVNTIVLRSRFSGKDSFRSLLQNIRETTLSAYENQSLPFDELVETLKVRHDLSRNPIFDVMVILQNADAGRKKRTQKIEGLTVNHYYEDRGNPVSKFDLLFTFAEDEGHIQMAIEYNTDIYKETTVLRIADHVGQLLEAMLDAPDEPICNLNYLTDAEQQQLLVANNDFHTPLPENKTAVDWVEEQVVKTPGQTVLVCGNARLSFEEFNSRVNQLAHWLRQKHNIQPEDVVAVQMDRHEKMVISQLAILKSGAAYIPVDPSHPQERKDYMLRDSSAKLLLDEAAFAAFEQEAGEYSKENPAKITVPSHKAYVLYTSGSTGRPKAVVVEHGSLSALLDMCWHNFCKQPAVMPLMSANSFDVSVFEIFMPLISGGTLHILSGEQVKDAGTVAKVLSEQACNALFAVPSFMTQIAWHINNSGTAGLHNNIKNIYTAGEAVTTSLLHGLRAAFPQAALHNLYGPTEATVYTTWHCYPAGCDAGLFNGPLLGHPIANSHVYILDKENKLVPPGVVGELHAGGACVARGYLNRPELTAEKFIENPWVPGERIYKTGDAARWLADGTIEFVGRMDDQVKIRGYRIELGEIEAALQLHELVSGAVVTTMVNTANEKDLVAYITASEPLTSVQLRTHLAKTLPAYMIPGIYIQLDSFPQTVSGKIDRKLLPRPEGAGIGTGVEYVAPRNPAEERLSLLWQEVLGKEKISVLDSFFNLGGHSLNATRLVAKIFREFEVKISLKDVFTHPVLESLAQLISQSAGATYISINPAPQQEAYPLSLSQRRLWVLSQFEQANIAYNMPGVYLLEGELDIPALEQACMALIRRHESLRTRFKETSQGEVMQYIATAEELNFAVNVQDISHEQEPPAKAQELLGHLFAQPFNLAEGPLLRVAVYKLAADQWVLGYVMHHIISDGWSMSIVLGEMLELYNSFHKKLPGTLQPLRIQYKDFAYWQHQQAGSNALEEQQQYWVKQLSGQLPALEIPADQVRPAIQTFNGAALGGALSVDASKKLHELCRSHNATIFMGLVAAIKALLYRYTGQEDIILGTVVAGREHADLENQIGFYINTLPLRTRFSGTDSFLELLKNTRQVTLDAYAHQLYPFDKLVEDLHLQRDMSRSPVFDVMVVLQNAGMDAGPDTMQDIKIHAFEGAGNPVSKFDLTFNFIEAGDQVHFGIEYNTDIFYAATAEQMIRHLAQLLEAALQAPETPLQQIAYLTGNEQQQLVNDYNNTQLPLPAAKTAVEYIEDQVLRTPAAAAISYGNTSLSYADMNTQVNRLAHWLREKHGVQPEDRVAIKMDRTEKMILATLGVLKSGAAYVPMDPAYPENRIQYMLDDSQCRVVLDEAAYAAFEQEAASYNASNPVKVSQPGHTAYVIYTSGSTGKPKGVMVQHSNMAALADQCLVFYCKQPVTMPFISSNSFDISIFEILLPLISGGTMQVLDGDQAKDMNVVAELLKASTGLFSVPSVLTQLAQHIKNAGNAADYGQLADIYTGGDAISTQAMLLLRELFPQATLHNLYGPTEATIYVTWKPYLPGCDTNEFKGTVLGKPVANTHIYILDRNGQLVPPGVIGDLHAGGARIAKGYLNQPALTAERFIDNPWVPGDRLYKTGDAARWLQNGDIEFIGRIDEQVKVRGYRIELGEIEAALLQHEDVEATAVVALPNNEGEKELVAYIKSGKELNTSTLRSHLGKTLPEYMVPGIYVQLETLPLTPNGKIDRKALPRPEGMNMQTGTAYVAPANEVEEKLLAIWKEFLNREQIGMHDNFFDLGGNSMTLVKMVRRISTAFNREIPVVTLFQYTNISALAQYISTGSGGDSQALLDDDDIQGSVNIMEQTLNLLNG